MASFTDKSFQFNPYIQELPVQEMVQVGMQKQAQYNQGVQKIQNYIDRVAGVDVYLDVDKQYLQSKLGELGNNLRTVAAGDFSNQQLVNSVAGMTSQISKDQLITNAIGSTARYRSGLSKIQKDIDEGKSNPANVKNFQKQAQPWLSSTKPGQVFNGAYNPHFDIMKFAKEQFDAVKPGKWSFDQLYDTDAEGNYKFNIVKDKKGNVIRQELIPSKYMVRMEKEGRLPAEVKATLGQIFSDPRVTKQLQITGEYNYGNIDEKGLSDMVYAQRDTRTADYNDKIAELTLRKTLEKTNEGKELIQEQIDKLETNIESINSSYDKIAQEAYKNPDYVRGYLYKESSLDNLQGMFGSVKVTKQAMESPLYQANFKEFQEANRMKEAAADLKYKYDALAQADELARLARENDLRIATLKAASGKKKPGTGDGLDDERGLERAENPSSINVIMNGEQVKTNAANDMLTTGNELVWNGFFANNPKNIEQLSKLVGPQRTKEQAIELMLRNAANQKKQPYVDFITYWSDKVVNELKTKPGGVPPLLADAYQLFKKKQKTFQSIAQESADVDTQVAKEVGSDLLKVINDVDVKDTPMKFQGKDVIVTKEDFYDLALYAKGNVTVGGYFDDKVHKENAKAAEARLNSRGKAFLIPTVLDKFATSTLSPSGILKDWKTTIRQGVEVLPFTDDVYLRNPKGWQVNLDTKGDFENNFKKLYKVIDTEASAKALTRKAELLQNTSFFKPDVKMPILTGDPETNRQTFNDIRRWTLEYGKSAKNLASSDELKGMLDVIGGDLADISFEAKTVTGPGGKKVIQVSGTDLKNNKSGSIVIADDEARNGLNIDVSGLYEPDEVTNVRRAIRRSPLGSTTTLDAGDVSTYLKQNGSYFEKFEFPRMIGNPNYDMQANIVKSGDMYYPYVYVATANGKRVVKQLDGDPNLENLIAKIKILGPEFAQGAFK
jgi:hypothetical protein